jgi:beta-galactosidase
MFFQWRAPRGGAELFHSALVPHAGPDSRVFREAVALGAALGRLAEADCGRVEAQVAVVWDAPSWWALQATHGPSSHIDYADEVYAAHRALWRAGFTADVVPVGAELSPYRLVVVPCLYAVSDATAAWLREHLAGGGHVVATYLSGVADECARIRLGGYPGALRELLGVRVEEFLPLDPADRVALDDGATGALWSERVHLTGATAVVSYRDGVLAGGPAITRHWPAAPASGGAAWYVSTRLDDAAYQRLLTEAARVARVRPTCPGAPDGVEVVRRRAGDASWLFLLNHADVPHAVAARGVDLLTGACIDGTVTLPAGGVAVVREL